MNKKIFTIAILTSMFLTSCKDTAKQVVTEKTTETVTQTPDEIKKSTSTDKNGKTLEMTFNNTKNSATFVLNGETIEMTLDSTTASGSNYKNDHYRFTECHGKTIVKKDDKIVFEAGKEVMPK